MMPVAPDRPAVSGAFARESARVVQLVRECGAGPGTAVPGLDWNVAQLVAHLSAVYLVFEQAVRGESQSPQLEAAVAEAEDAGAGAGAGKAPRFSVVLAAANASALDPLAVDDLRAAADGLAARAASLGAALEAAEDFDRQVATPWYGSTMTRSVGTLACLSITETIVHCRDLACSIGADPTMSAGAAAAAAPTVMSAMLPLMLDGRKAAGFRGTFEVRLRGAQGFGMHIADGTVECFEPGARAADCVLTLDPRAALLLGFRRRSFARTALTGGALAGGRRPWLGLKFPGLFVSP